MTTVTIRVPETTHQRLRRLAEDQGRSIGEVVDEAVRRLETEAFWLEVNAGYARLRADPVASADYDAEIANLDTISLLDFAEPPYEDLTDPRPAR